MGNDEITNDVRESLAQYLDNLQLTLVKMSEFYHNALSYYTTTIQNAIESALNGCLIQGELTKLHQDTKKDTKSQVIYSNQNKSLEE